MNSFRLMLAGFALLLSNAVNAQPRTPATLSVYIGTYTGPKSKGIYLAQLDLASGKLSLTGVAAESPNPSFLAIHPSGKYLYAANELWNKPIGSVTAFAINADGTLKELNQRTSGGNGPCYVSVDPTGKVAMVANYGSGSVESLPIEADGKLGAPASFLQHAGTGANPKRQEGPHGHCIDPDPAGKFALSCDLGLDQVLVYRIDPATAKLTPNDPPFATVAAGAGPRHLAFHPSGKFVYVTAEMGNTITAFQYDGQKGTLQSFQTVSTIPADYKPENTTAEIAVHPSGKFLYGSNRGHDSISIFTIDENGKLTPAGHASTQGKQPRNFAIDPTGQYLIAANQSGNNLVVFRINPTTGQLTPTGSMLELSAPVCVQFLMPK